MRNRPGQVIVVHDDVGKGCLARGVYAVDRDADRMSPPVRDQTGKTFQHVNAGHTLCGMSRSRKSRKGLGPVLDDI